nr:protein transport protein SEC31-like [Lolium perenne]
METPSGPAPSAPVPAPPPNPTSGSGSSGPALPPPAPAQPPHAPAPSAAVVAGMVASTRVGVKKRRAHVVTSPPPISPRPSAPSAPSPPLPRASPPRPRAPPPRPRAPRPKRNKPASLGPKKARPKKPSSRKKAAPPPVSVPLPPSANEVLDEMSAPTASYMGLLNDDEVNIGFLPSFRSTLKETYADLRYKDMAGSKEKSFAFKHCWALFKNLDKWKVRDQESNSKKSDIFNMDDTDDEGRNHGKPKGSEKANERMKLEADTSSLKDKLDQMIKTKKILH